MFTFTHRNPEMQLDKARTALMVADFCSRQRGPIMR